MNYPEPKFRAWIPKDMSGDPQMFYQNAQYLGSFLRRANTFTSNMEHDKYGIAAEPPKLTLLQWTRMVDTNGKEIYDGDIVSGDYDGQVLEFPVLWYRSGWYVGYKSTTGHNYTSLDALSGVKVIGNVFENPELIKNK